MKCILVMALSAVLILSTVAAPAEEVTPKLCKEACTFELVPVCGYDGNCYTRYPNQCTYDWEKCSKNNSLETVDMSLCEQADKNNHPSYKMCSK